MLTDERCMELLEFNEHRFDPPYPMSTPKVTVEEFCFLDEVRRKEAERARQKRFGR